MVSKDDTMKIVKILSHDEFEVEGDLAVGDVVNCKGIMAIVVSIHQEGSEYSDYMHRMETEDIKKFLPDLVEGRRIAKCLALCTTNLDDAFTLPEIGTEVEKIDKDNLRNIHLKNGELRIPYLVKLLKRSNIDVARNLVLKLIEVIPEEKDLLEIILAEIEYKRMKGLEL